MPFSLYACPGVVVFLRDRGSATKKVVKPWFMGSGQI